MVVLATVSLYLYSIFICVYYNVWYSNDQQSCASKLITALASFLSFISFKLLFLSSNSFFLL